MRKQKIYLETTVFNYFFDKDRDEYKATVKLFDEIQAGKFEVFTSTQVLRELKNTSEEKKRTDMMNLITQYNAQVLDADIIEVDNLASKYITEGVIPDKYRSDAIHIAVASVNELDCIVSMNFQHINKLKTKITTAHINGLAGYTKPIAICSSREVVDNE